MKGGSIILILIIFVFPGFLTAQEYTWSEDIAPIVYQNCSPCHHTGGIAPFELMNILDVYEWAEGIQHAVTDRYMPPWPADPEYMHFANETYLAEEEINAIVWWIEHNMPTGDMNLAPDPPEFLPSGSLLDTIDFVVEIEPYTLQYNYDEYRWFVIENPFNEDFYISKLEVIPGLENVVHHADLFYDLTGTSLAYDNTDPLPGFNSSTGAPVNSHYINAWQPGANPAEYPPDWGIKVPANADLVVEIHFGPGGIGQIDSTKMNLQFVVNTTDVRPVYASWMLYDSPPVLVDGPLVIPANEIVTFHQISAPLTSDLSFISICPHMHYLGKSYKVWYELDGVEYPLINIPQWDFHWQKYYTFQNVKKIPAGSILKSEGIYDNTSDNHDNPFDPPQDCYKGATTLDEMFLCYFIWAYYEDGDEFINMDNTVVSISETDPIRNPELSLFPNPAKDLIHLTGSLPNSYNILFKIYDARGIIVHSYQRINNGKPLNETFDLRGLSSGQYFLEWKCNELSGLNQFLKE